MWAILIKNHNLFKQATLSGTMKTNATEIEKAECFQTERIIEIPKYSSVVVMTAATAACVVYQNVLK